MKKLPLSLRIYLLFSVLFIFVFYPSSYAQSDSSTVGTDSIKMVDSLVSEKESVQTAENYLKGLLSSFGDQFGLNGYMHHIVSETIVDEASAFKNSIQTESQFQLYPFSYTSSISINPNNNFFLLRGPSIDLSQTHTTLPNYNLTAKIDSSQNYYIFQDQFGGMKYNNSFKQKTVVERKDYFTENFTNELRSSFTKSVASSLSKQEEKTGGAVRLFTASVSTNETFQKIFGGDEVAVDATGNINLNVSGASEKSSNQNQTTGKTSQFTPKFEQKQQFNLRGTIGRKVEILFDQDSEREFDFENNIKLTYTGFDDEILQKLEAGNIDLSLPGTEFVTTGGQNKGLFGVKALFKLANLNLTTIASLQRGEKTKLKFKGGSEQGTTIKRSSYEYAKAKFFFLDNSYRDNYEKYQARYQHTYFPEKEIVAIKVFKASQNNQKVPGSTQGTALTNTSILADPNNVNLSFDALKQLDPTAQSGWFLEMIKGSDYTYDSRLGIVTMTSPIQLGDILAVWYQTQDGTEIGNTDTTNLLLKMLWSNNPGPSHPTWDLELKNIYDLGVTGLSEEDIRTLKIKFKPNGVNNELTVVNDLDNKSRGIMEILHIDEAGETSGGPDNIVDKEVIDFGRGYLVFPRLRPFDPDATNLSGFSNETYPFVIGTDSVRFPNFYDLDRGFQSDQKNRTANQFSIELTTTKKTSTITLGFNVLEGSEEVILNGTPLQKDVDYVIDYFSGSIELLNQAALLPNADLEINYEQAQLFQIDKKSIFGARAEYNLSEHGFGQNSFIGTTALFQSQSTINKRVQLGEEPYNNFVWDVNTNLEFNAKYLTNFVNYIPLVSSNQPSKINIRAEYAKILPNPNTSNGLIRQNENGVSYIDDFEAVKRTFPLGTTRRSWALSSIPTFKDSSMRGKIIWFQNQEEKQKLSQIDVNQSERVTILEIALKPQTRNPSRISESWGGIMKGFSISAAKELAETKFVELWIKNENNQKARVTIDLGAISEDQNSNNELDKEIKSGLQIGISDDEDVGLDNYSKAQEDSVLNSYGIIPGSTNLTEEQQKIIDSLQIIYPWGVINASAEDPFGDDWIADQAKLEFVDGIKKAIKAGNIDQIKVNGLEENVTGKEFDGTTKFGDTEDLDANGVIDLNNSFFRYSFSIDPNSADTNLVIGKGKDPNWRLYRIPISRPDTAINNPSLQNIRNARLWVSPETNDPSIISFQLAEMQFVSSEWTFPEENPNGLVLPPNLPPLNADDAAKIVEISYANTEETIFYEKPDNVKNEYVSGQAGNNRDRQVKEQSLSLKLNNLPSKASAVIIKNIQSSDLRNYGRIRMFVHGDTRGNLTLPLEEVQTDQSPIRFFFRFGGDKNNYFEIEQPLFADWAEKKNSIDIDFSDLSKKKFDASVSADSLNTKTFDLGEGKILRIKGNPSTASIRQLYIGAINDENSTPYTGEIWVNELRVSDVNDAPGHAAKAALVFNLADFASFSGLLQYRTSEFRTIDQRFDANSGDSRNWNFGGSFNLHKFYIERWGINLPFSVNFSHNQVDPKYVPNDDILVKDARKQNELNLNTLENRSFIISDSLNYLNSIGGDTSYI
ncbi:cell surface protein SprA, partial [bacterium]|nr:cell surface protein SprA [bacterium]